MSRRPTFGEIEHDPRDPSPWQALWLDDALPLDPDAKRAFLASCSSRSRQFLLPVVRPLARLSMVLIQLVRIVLPGALASSKLLHRTIHQGMSRFVSPEANLLILRHIHAGSEILAFIAANARGVEVETEPLRPERLADVKDDLFLKHDLNLFNFIIRLNAELRAKGLSLAPPDELDFGCITDGPFPIEELPRRWTNVLDVETAIELYTPLYQLLLTDSDFWRASHSLQFDETLATYLAILLRDPTHLALVNNRHPMVPESTLRSGWRLMLHGLSAEHLHALLRAFKRGERDADGGLLG